MKAKPDDRSNNVERIQENIDNTIKNIHRANDMIEITSDPKTKEVLKERNKRRDEALKGMRCEIKDEAKARGYK